MLNSGFRDAIGSCRIIAIWRPRIRRSWRARIRVSSSPANRIEPPAMRAPGGNRPTIDMQVVVLPHPDSPPEGARGRQQRILYPWRALRGAGDERNWPEPEGPGQV